MGTIENEQMEQKKNPLFLQIASMALFPFKEIKTFSLHNRNNNRLLYIRNPRTTVIHAATLYIIQKVSNSIDKK